MEKLLHIHLGLSLPIFPKLSSPHLLRGPIFQRVAKRDAALNPTPNLLHRGSPE
jgi:hypothetical protein